MSAEPQLSGSAEALAGLLRREMADVVRQASEFPDLARLDPEASRSFGGPEAELESHLVAIRDSVLTERSGLFDRHLGWAKVLHVGRGHRQEHLPAVLESLRTASGKALPESCAAVVQERIDRGLAALDALPSELPSHFDAPGPLVAAGRRYLEALLAGDRDRAFRIVHDQIGQGATLRQIYLDVFQRALYEVGRLWQIGRVDVAQEHFCTAATQQILSQLYGILFDSDVRDRRMLAASVGDNFHEVGARIVADFFEMEGWDTCYLGASTPADDLAAAVVERDCHLVCLSVATTPQLDRARRTVERVRAAAPGVPILVGGRPLVEDPSLSAWVGADATAADAEAAVETARELVP